MAHQGSTGDSLLLQVLSDVVCLLRNLVLPRKAVYLLSPRLCFFMIFFVMYLFHYENMPMQHTAIFHGVKMTIFS